MVSKSTAVRDQPITLATPFLNIITPPNMPGITTSNHFTARPLAAGNGGKALSNEIGMPAPGAGYGTASHAHASLHRRYVWNGQRDPAAREHARQKQMDSAWDTSVRWGFL
jgi:hypothetical protein